MEILPTISVSNNNGVRGDINILKAEIDSLKAQIYIKKELYIKNQNVELKNELQILEILLEKATDQYIELKDSFKIN